jgi:hypothetical protein
MTPDDAPGQAYVGTCDYGDCDRLTQAIVWIRLGDHWLSLCAKHARLQLKNVRDCAPGSSADVTA